MLPILLRVRLLKELVEEIINLLVGMDDLELGILHSTVAVLAHLTLVEELSQL